MFSYVLSFGLEFGLPALVSSVLHFHNKSIFKYVLLSSDTGTLAFFDKHQKKVEFYYYYVFVPSRRYHFGNATCTHIYNFVMLIQYITWVMNSNFWLILVNYVHIWKSQYLILFNVQVHTVNLINSITYQQLLSSLVYVILVKWICRVHAYCSLHLLEPRWAILISNFDFENTFIFGLDIEIMDLEWLKKKWGCLRTSKAVCPQ